MPHLRDPFWFQQQLNALYSYKERKTWPKGWLGYRWRPTGEIYEAVGFTDGHILTISPTSLFRGGYWEVADEELLEPLTQAAEAFLLIARASVES